MIAPIATEWGHSIPPEGPHTITFHVPGWAILNQSRGGDYSWVARLSSIYPRFGLFGPVRDLVMGMHKLMGLPETHTLLPFVSPDMFQTAKEYVVSPHRKEEDRLDLSDLAFRIVDLNGIRLYCLAFPAAKSKSVTVVWQDLGVGISSRFAEANIPHLDTLTEVPFDGNLDAIPTPTYLPDTEAHAKVRSRISGLLHRAAIEPSAPQPPPEDITLYPTGMAAIHRLGRALAAYRPGGQILSLGALFHNTWHLFEEISGGVKHFGEVTTAAHLDAVEAWLDGEKPNICFAFVEFPSNPIGVSIDLTRLRAMADKHGFPIVVDDTIGSFANLDLIGSGAADAVLTSITKSFGGYADVMGGSVALSPSSAHYAALSRSVRDKFHNELFAGDAEKFLSNSEDYLERSTVLDRNASQLAAFLDSQTVAKRPASGLIAVDHPSVAPTKANYEKFMRRKTDDYTPGYGCLLNLEFEDTVTAEGFYENVKLHISPHLGAHRTLALAFADMSYGKTPEMAAYHRAYGIRKESVRISVGLEDFDDILGRVKEALEFSEKAKAERGEKKD